MGQGINISGLSINENLEAKINELEKILGVELKFKKEIIFEEALNNWMVDKCIDIFFSNKGTLLLTPITFSDLLHSNKNLNILTFLLCEMNQSYIVSYSENGKFIRSLYIDNGEIVEDEGKKFDFENEYLSRENMILNIINLTLGENLKSFEDTTKFYRYSYKQL